MGCPTKMRVSYSGQLQLLASIISTVGIVIIGVSYFKVVSIYVAFVRYVSVVIMKVSFSSSSSS